MIQLLNNIPWEFFLRVAGAFVVGAVIGLERHAHGRPAGLRTHILVCVGSAAVMVAFARLLQVSVEENFSVVKMDPARAAAGIITGVGFLGAGTILKGRDIIKGLTTAATIWVVAALGIIVGLGEYALTALVTLLVLFSLTILDQIKFPIDRYHILKVEGTGGEKLFRMVEEILEKKGFRIKDSGMEVEKGGQGIFVFTLKQRSREVTPLIVSDILKTPGTRKVHWS